MFKWNLLRNFTFFFLLILGAGKCSGALCGMASSGHKEHSGSVFREHLSSLTPTGFKDFNLSSVIAYVGCQVSEMLLWLAIRHSLLEAL